MLRLDPRTASRNRRIREALDKGCMTELRRIDPVTYIYMCYKQHYYLGQPLVSDARFDDYEDNIIKKFNPDNPCLQVVGLLYPKCGCETC